MIEIKESSHYENAFSVIEDYFKRIGYELRHSRLDEETAYICDSDGHYIHYQLRVIIVNLHTKGSVPKYALFFEDRKMIVDYTYDRSKIIVMFAREMKKPSTMKIKPKMLKLAR